MRAIVLLLVVGLVGCGEKKELTEEEMSPVGAWGQWNDENDGGRPDTSREFDYTYVFSEDGTYTITIGVQTDSGTWKAEDGTVWLDSGATLKVEGGNTMEGTTPSGTKVVLHRM